jgi:hypothetical protein
VGLERGPLSLVSTIGQLLERKSSVSGLEIRDYSHRGSAALTTRHPSIRKSWHQLLREKDVVIVEYARHQGGRRRRIMFNNYCYNSSDLIEVTGSVHLFYMIEHAYFRYADIYIYITFF